MPAPASHNGRVFRDSAMTEVARSMVVKINNNAEDVPAAKSDDESAVNFLREQKLKINCRKLKSHG